jgi:hypothetical protein
MYRDEWIKWCKGFAKRPKIYHMADALEVDRCRVAVACMEFWEFVDEETTSGRLKNMSLRAIDDLVSLPGFAAAMMSAEVGWISAQNGVIFVSYWTKHNSHSAKSRAIDNAKHKRQRKLNAGRATGRATGQNGDSQRDRRGTQQEEEEEEQLNKPQQADSTHMAARLGLMKMRDEDLTNDATLFAAFYAETRRSNRVVGGSEEELQFVFRCALLATTKRGVVSPAAFFKDLVKRGDRDAIPAEIEARASRRITKYRSEHGDEAHAAETNERPA